MDMATEEEAGCSTPTESIMSTGTNLSDLTDMSCFSGVSSSYRTFLPEKLQIVKPIEGKDRGVEFHNVCNIITVIKHPAVVE